MTKKDYVLIARVFKASNEIWEEEREGEREKWEDMRSKILAGDYKNKKDAEAGIQTVDNRIDAINKILSATKVIVDGLSNHFALGNPRFDEVRFKEACGVKVTDDNY